MKIKDLVDAPQWLKNAVVEDEDVEIINGVVVWRNGTWCNGIWCDGTWRDGTWYNGIWHNGTWCNGTWYNGIWRNGIWRNGTWRDGTWYNGIWHNGTWCNGIWCDGTWHNGIWRNGIWYNGIWRNGIWRNGTWHNGTWCNGTWYNGIWRNGTWYNGTWRDGTWYNGTWRDKNINDRLLFMASKIGIVFNSRGIATAYRTTQKDGSGRHVRDFVQKTGKYYETDLPISGSGTCVCGIHVSSMATAQTYFGVDATAQLWEVKFRREDLLDCDGEKARISGGIFKKIDCPFMKRKDK